MFIVCPHHRTDSNWLQVSLYPTKEFNFWTARTRRYQSPRSMMMTRSSDFIVWEIFKFWRYGDHSGLHPGCWKYVIQYTYRLLTLTRQLRSLVNSPMSHKWTSSSWQMMLTLSDKVYDKNDFRFWVTQNEYKSFQTLSLHISNETRLAALQIKMLNLAAQSLHRA